MITYCPHCGRSLEEWLKNGLYRCTNCKRCFDSSSKNTILAAAWMARCQHLDDVSQMAHLGLSSVQEEFIKEFVIEGCNNHEEVVQILERLDIPELTA